MSARSLGYESESRRARNILWCLAVGVWVAKIFARTVGLVTGALTVLAGLLLIVFGGAYFLPGQEILRGDPLYSWVLLGIGLLVVWGGACLSYFSFTALRKKDSEHL